MKSGVWLLIKDLRTLDIHRKWAITVTWASLIIEYTVCVLDLSVLRKFLTEFSLYKTPVLFSGYFPKTEFWIQADFL